MMDSKTPGVRRKAAIRLLASLLIIALILYFLGRVLYSNWEQVKQYQWEFHLPTLLLSSACLVGSYFVDIAVWRYAIMRMGARISYLRSLRLYFAAGLAKYIPGTVWQFLGWFYLAQREGISKIVAGTSVIICQALSALAGALLAAAAFAAYGSQDVVRQLVPLLLILPIGLFVLQPRFVGAILNWGLKRLGRQTIDLNLSFRDLAAIFVFYLLSYILWGLALFFFTNALTPLSWTNFAPFLGVFPAAYALGLIAPFAPAGLGVREGTLTFLLSFFVPLPIATVIALLTRPWMMAVEIIAAALALLSYALEKRRGTKKP
jgi:glycosyltransferase 2 family protein